MASVPNGGGYKTVGALCAEDKKGAGNQYVDQGKLVMEPCHKSDDTFVVSQETFLNVDEGVSPPLKARDYKAPHAVCYEESVVAIEGNGMRPSHKGNGINISDIQYTLNTTEVHAVGYMEKNSEKKDCETLCVQTANTGSNGSNINHDVSATLAKNNTLAVAYREEYES